VSHNIRPVFPVAAGARVIAFWEDDAGRRRDDPAWVQSPHGFWMTHVLLEGDVAAKQALLLALAGSCDPALWRVAAEHARQRCGRLGTLRSLADAVERIGRLADQAENGARMRVLLAQAQALHSDMLSDIAGGRYGSVPGAGRRVNALLTEAYALGHPPRADEFRGVWNHSGLGLAPGDWTRTARLLAANGLTAVFPNVVQAGLARYPSRVFPAAAECRLYGDPLAQCLAAGRRYGLAVHPWIVCWNVSGAPRALLGRLEAQGRLQVSADGTTLAWLCPSHPDNVAYMLDGIRELVRAYRVDGVHLDYVRYPSGDSCYCAGCRRRFAAVTGRIVRRWPADVRAGPLAGAYRQWRRDQITRFITLARSELRRADPTLMLSAAVYPSYATCRESIAQDWAEWLREGRVDFVCPMDYTADATGFAAVVSAQLALPGARGRVYPGIGVTSTESRLGAVDTIDQIVALRRAGAAGFMLFDLNATLEQDILPFLRMGLTSDRAR
jgi:uncharacterized lipoprotein YddW (UPF0748 family)